MSLLLAVVQAPLLALLAVAHLHQVAVVYFVVGVSVDEAAYWVVQL